MHGIGRFRATRLSSTEGSRHVSNRVDCARHQALTRAGNGRVEPVAGSLISFVSS